jgi:hypothetical protein
MVESTPLRLVSPGDDAGETREGARASKKIARLWRELGSHGQRTLALRMREVEGSEKQKIGSRGRVLYVRGARRSSCRACLLHCPRCRLRSIVVSAHAATTAFLEQTRTQPRPTSPSLARRWARPAEAGEQRRKNTIQYPSTYPWRMQQLSWVGLARRLSLS